MNPIQKYITEDRIDEAIDKLLSSTSNDKYLHTSVQQLKSRYSKLKKDNWSGILSKEEADVEQNRITSSLLEISDKIDFGLRTNKKWVLLLIGIGIIILTFWIIQSNTPPIEKPNNPVIHPNDSIKKDTQAKIINPPVEKPTPTPPPAPTFKFIIEGKNMTNLVEACLKKQFKTGFNSSFKVLNYDDIKKHGTSENYRFYADELKLQTNNGGILETGIQLKNVIASGGGLTKNDIKKDIMEQIKENINSICEKLKSI